MPARPLEGSANTVLVLPAFLRRLPAAQLGYRVGSLCGAGAWVLMSLEQGVLLEPDSSARVPATAGAKYSQS